MYSNMATIVLSHKHAYETIESLQNTRGPRPSCRMPAPNDDRLGQINQSQPSRKAERRLKSQQRRRASLSLPALILAMAAIFGVSGATTREDCGPLTSDSLNVVNTMTVHNYVWVHLYVNMDPANFQQSYCTEIAQSDLYCEAFTTDSMPMPDGFPIVCLREATGVAFIFDLTKCDPPASCADFKLLLDYQDRSDGITFTVNLTLEYCTEDTFQVADPNPVVDIVGENTAPFIHTIDLMENLSILHAEVRSIGFNMRCVQYIYLDPDQVSDSLATIPDPLGTAIQLQYDTVSSVIKSTSTTIHVKVRWAQDFYTTYDPSHIKSVTITVNFTPYCLTMSTDWTGGPSAAFDLPVGTLHALVFTSQVETTVQNNDDCRVAFQITAGDFGAGQAFESVLVASSSLETPVGYQYDMEIYFESTEIAHVGQTATISLMQHYKLFETFEAISTQTFTITFTMPTSCLTETYLTPPADLVTTFDAPTTYRESWAQSRYTEGDTPAYCGLVQYECSWPSSYDSIFSYDVTDPNDILFIVEESGINSAFYGTTEVTWSYKFANQNGAASSFTLTVNIVDICSKLPITQSGDTVIGLTVMAWIHKSTTLRINDFDGSEQSEPTDCNLGYRNVVVDPPNFEIESLAFGYANSQIVIPDLPRDMIGSYTINLSVVYDQVPDNGVEFPYSFTLEVVFECTAELLTPNPGILQIPAQLKIKVNEVSHIDLAGPLFTNMIVENRKAIDEQCQESYTLTDDLGGALTITRLSFDVTRLEMNAQDQPLTIIGSYSTQIQQTFFYDNVENNIVGTLDVVVVIDRNCAYPMQMMYPIDGISSSKRELTSQLHLDSTSPAYRFEVTSESLTEWPEVCKLSLTPVSDQSEYSLAQLESLVTMERVDSHIINVYITFRSGTFVASDIDGKVTAPFSLRYEGDDYADYLPFGFAQTIDITTTVLPACSPANLSLIQPTQLELSYTQYIVSEPAYEVDLDETFNSPNCGHLDISYRIRVDNYDGDLPEPLQMAVTYETSYPQFVTHTKLQLYATDSNYIGTVYTVEVSATVQTVTPFVVEDMRTMNLLITNAFDPCVSAYSTFTGPAILPDITYRLAGRDSDPPFIQSMEVFTFEAPGCSGAVIEYHFPEDLHPASIISFDPDLMQYSVFTTDYNDSGKYEVSIFVQLEGNIFNSLIHEERTFTLIVVGYCAVVLIEEVPAIGIQEYYLGQAPELSLDVSSLFQLRDELLDKIVYGCGLYTVTIVGFAKQSGLASSASATVITSDDANPLIECCNTASAIDIGTYDLTLQVGLLSYPYVTKSFQVPILVAPVCEELSIINLSIYKVFPIEAFYGETVYQEDLSFEHSLTGLDQGICGDLAISLHASAPSYLTADNDNFRIKSAPNDESQITKDEGVYTSFYVYLADFEAETKIELQLLTIVNPICEVISLEASNPEQDLGKYVLFASSDALIDITFGAAVYSADSTQAYCEAHSTEKIMFKIGELDQNESPQWFTLSGATQASISTTNKLDDGIYEGLIWYQKFLPRGFVFESTINVSFKIEIIYDPCILSYIEAIGPTDFAFEIRAENFEQPQAYPLPLIDNNVTRDVRNAHCGPIDYEVTKAYLAYPGATDPLALTLSDDQFYFSIYTEDHSLHDSSFTFGLTLSMVDYRNVAPVDLTFTVSVTSKCANTLIIQINDDQDFTTWFVNNENTLLFYYQIGWLPTERVLNIVDSVSLAAREAFDYWSNRDAFCGEISFDLALHVDEEDEEDEEVDAQARLRDSPLQIDRSVSFTGKTSLYLYTRELSYETSSDELVVEGVFGGQVLDKNRQTVIQSIEAEVKTSLDFFPAIQTVLQVKALLVNSCDRVYLARTGLYSTEISIVLEAPDRLRSVLPYASQIDLMLQQEYGFSGLQKEPLCGRPKTDFKCYQPGPLKDLLLQTPFELEIFGNIEPEDLLSSESFYQEMPSFIKSDYRASTGILKVSAGISVQSQLTHNWDSNYVCLIDAYLNLMSTVARSYDFMYLTVSQVSAEDNTAPQIQGLDSEFIATYGSETSGKFKISDPDQIDASSLTVQLSVSTSTGEVTEDCGCVTFRANYKAESGPEKVTDLAKALQLNKRLSEFEVEFSVTPTEAMIEKTYEVSITVMDFFDQTTGSLLIYTDGEVEAEADQSEAFQEGIELAASLAEAERVAALEAAQEGESTVYFNERAFHAQYAHLFYRNKEEKQVKETLEMMAQLLETPMMLISSLDKDGKMEARFSREILLPEAAFLPDFINYLTYQYVIDLAIEVNDFVIRGQPKLSKKWSQKPDSTVDSRRLQDLTQGFNETAVRMTGFSTAQDDFESNFIDSRQFTWSIEGLKSDRIELSFIFAKPQLISASTQEKLRLQVNRPDLLLRSQGGLASQEIFSMDFKLPKQAEIGFSIETVEEAAKQGKNALQVISIINIIVSLVLQSSFDDIWTILNTIALVIYLPLVNLRYPDLPKIVINAISSLVTFDVYETLNEYTREYGGFDLMPRNLTPTPAFNDNFEDNNFESGNTLLLLSTVNLIILYLIWSFANACLSRLWCWSDIRCCKRTARRYSFKKQFASWNRLFITGFIELYICCLVPLLEPQDSTEPNLLALDWSVLGTQDKLCLIYGMALFFWLTLLLVVYGCTIVYLAPKLHKKVLSEMKEEASLSITVYEQLLRKLKLQGRLHKLKQTMKAKKSLKKAELLEAEKKPSVKARPSVVDHSASTVINPNGSMLLLSEPDMSQDFGACYETDKLAQSQNKASSQLSVAQSQAESFHSQTIRETDPQLLTPDLDSETKQALIQDLQELDQVTTEFCASDLKFDMIYRRSARFPQSKIKARLNELQAHLARLNKKYRRQEDTRLTKFQTNLLSLFSSLFHGLKYDQKTALYYHMVYFARRSLLIFAIFFMDQNTLIQIQMIYLADIAALVFLLGARPNELPSHQRLELFNELCVVSCVFLTLLMFLAQTTLTDEEEAQKLNVYVGYCFTVVICLCLVLNLLRLGCTQCRTIRLKLIRKKNIFDRDSKAYDAQMNIGIGGGYCDCKCLKCSHQGHRTALKYKTTTFYDPIVPEYFSLEPIVCEKEVPAIVDVPATVEVPAIVGLAKSQKDNQIAVQQPEIQYNQPDEIDIPVKRRVRFQPEASIINPKPDADTQVKKRVSFSAFVQVVDPKPDASGTDAQGVLDQSSTQPAGQTVIGAGKAHLRQRYGSDLALLINSKKKQPGHRLERLKDESVIDEDKEENEEDKEEDEEDEEEDEDNWWFCPEDESDDSSEGSDGSEESGIRRKGHLSKQKRYRRWIRTSAFVEPGSRQWTSSTKQARLRWVNEQEKKEQQQILQDHLKKIRAEKRMQKLHRKRQKLHLTKSQPLC